MGDTHQDSLPKKDTELLGWFVFPQEMNAPSFRVEKNEDGSMHLHYYSDRRGLCHIVPGKLTEGREQSSWQCHVDTVSYRHRASPYLQLCFA